MTLRYFDAYKRSAPNNPKESYVDDFAAIMAEDFENAPNVFYNEIKKETSYGSSEFEAIDKVRVDSVVDYNTGTSLGDDFKVFLFMPDFPKPTYGMKFKWNNNYYLVINTNNDESMNVSAEVRRCNNQLRFFDENKNKIYEPCIIDYTLSATTNDIAGNIPLGNGQQKIWCQRNTKTELIKPNDTFLFGTPSQRFGVRVLAGGIKNMLNSSTTSDSSSSLTEIHVEHYEIDTSKDNIVNGFANDYINNFTISINNDSSIYGIGVSAVLTATVFLNSFETTKAIIWESSDENIATVNNDGVLNTIAAGSVTITVRMEDNEDVYDSIEISVDASPAEDNYEIIFEPNIDYIYQNETIEFACWLYKNGIKQDDEFIFSNMTSDVPASKYEIVVIDENHFSVENKGMYMEAPVLINCVSGDNHETLNITLKGLY